MRRPPKPFVTEYKSPNRRAKDGPDNIKMPAPAAGEKSNGGAPRWPSRDEPGEDSYEAAMRAADALFSSGPARARQTDQPDAPQPDHHDAPSASAPAAPQPRAQPMPAQPEVAVPAKPPVGRVLQAIDQPEVDPFAALEAEHAPKRRGRKPGSKNKPKADTGLAPDAPLDRPIAARMPAVYEAPARPRPAPMIRVAETPPEPTTNRKRDSQKYAWVRATLPRGERWKQRRLPKVAW